jgi:hypothetical protein
MTAIKLARRDRLRLLGFFTNLSVRIAAILSIVRIAEEGKAG